jgi:hypothetical protein
MYRLNHVRETQNKIIIIIIYAIEFSLGGCSPYTMTIKNK